MVNQQLIDWIKSQETQGYSKQQLYNSLIQQGHNPNEVNEALKIAFQPNQQIDQSSEPVKNSFNLLPLVIIGVVIISIIVGGIFFFTSQDDNADSSTEVNSNNLLADKEAEQESEQPIKEVQGNEPSETDLADCDTFPDKLDACEPFSCKFEHPFTGEMMEKEVIGLVNSKCQYTEEMPNNGKMDCEYTESMRKAAAQYYRDVATAESVGTSVNADLGSGDVETTYTIDGKEVENPLQEAMDAGQCVISGYGNPIEDNKCPPGTEYKGETYTYENGEQIAHPICSDPNVICPACENCISGNAKKVISGTGEVCFECQFDKDCKEGYHCFDHQCIDNNVLKEITETCSMNSDCEQYICEECEKGYKVCKSGWSSWDSDMKYKCIECDDFFNDCAEGYRCKKYTCVVE